jgi:hypothetical protein
MMADEMIERMEDENKSPVENKPPSYLDEFESQDQESSANISGFGCEAIGNEDIFAM